MKLQPAVKKESLRMACGIGILTVLMLAVYVAIGRFHYTVLLGALLGASFAALNFFLMAVNVQKAAAQMNGVRLPPEDETDQEEGAEPQEREELPQQKEARRIVQRSYYLRMALTAAVAVLAIKAPVFDAIPALLALFFPRIVVTVLPLIDKFQKGEKGN